MFTIYLIKVALAGILSLPALVHCQLIPFDKNDQHGEPASSTAVSTSSLPIQIEVVLLRFQNPHGIIYSGKKCDFFAWGCDINGFAYIDSEKPYDEWPGQRDIRASDHFWYEGENSSPVFNKKFTMTVCEPAKFKAGNLRVNLMDVDGFMRGGDDFINNFNCIFTKPKFITTEPKTTFSNEMVCDALYSNPLMGLFFKYRMFRLIGPTNCPSPK